jgi:hypothetical protein
MFHVKHQGSVSPMGQYRHPTLMALLASGRAANFHDPTEPLKLERREP